MKHPLLVFIYLMSSGYLFAQTAGQFSSVGGSGMGYTQALVNQIVGDTKTQKEILSKRTGINEFTGSPYVTDTFSQVNIYYNEELIDQFFYRYNALNEEVEVKETNSLDEAPKRLMADKEIQIDLTGNKERIMSFKTFIDKNKNTTNGYLTLLLKGQNFDLYRRIRVKFTEGQKAQNSFVPNTPNRFTQFTEYYYQKDGINRIDELKQSNSSLLKILPNEMKSKMKEYLKENKLNIKQELDLIKALEFVNNPISN